jgi:hypothetical protein
MTSFGFDSRTLQRTLCNPWNDSMVDGFTWQQFTGREIISAVAEESRMIEGNSRGTWKIIRNTWGSDRV